MTLRVSDWQSESDLDSIRKSCDVSRSEYCDGVPKLSKIRYLDSVWPFIYHFSTWDLFFLHAAYEGHGVGARSIIPPTPYLNCQPGPPGQVQAVLVPVVVWFWRMPECEVKRTAVCPYPGPLLINVISTYPCAAAASAVPSVQKILVDCLRCNGSQVAVFLLAESFCLVPGFLVGAPVVAAITMLLPVVAAALLKNLFKEYWVKSWP